MALDIEALNQRLTDIDEESKNIVAAVQADERDELTDDENDRLEALDVEYKNIKRQIRNLERVEDRMDETVQSQGRKTDPDDVVNTASEIVKDSAVQRIRARITEPAEVKRNFGFRSFGEFALAVKNAMPSGGGRVDPRLMRNALTTYSTEGTGADGGYLVPPDYRAAIVKRIFAEDTILSRTDSWETDSNQIIVPADETTPWQATGGILPYWESEAGQKTQSKLSLKQKTLRLNKLTTLVPVTDELLSDASALDTYLSRKVPEKMNFAVNLALIQGTGVGEPQGILNCNSLVTVSKESGQTADTVVFENIVNMWARMYGPYRADAVWMINQDIEPELFTMSFEGTSSSVPAYMPANGLAGAPYSTLMGRPVIATQACETVGDLGDIIFASWPQYWTGMKNVGIRQDISIHLWFDYDVTAYRFIMRLGGQCWLSAAIDPRDGSNTLGAFIALEART